MKKSRFRSAPRLHDAIAGDLASRPVHNDLSLVDEMVEGLDGMTADTWSDRVFSMGETAKEVTET